MNGARASGELRDLKAWETYGPPGPSWGAGAAALTAGLILLAAAAAWRRRRRRLASPAREAARTLPYCRRIFSIGRPLASSSISLSR